MFLNDTSIAVFSPHASGAGVGRIARAEFARVGRGQNQLQVVLRYPTGLAASVALSNIVFEAAERPLCSLDFNGDGAVNTTDALMFNRWLLGFRGDSLVAGITPYPAGTSVSAFATVVTSRITITAVHDFDLDTRVSAATDGLLFTRLTQGLLGTGVTNFALGQGAQRNTYDLIRTHMNSVCGTSYPPLP